jgi:D-alanine-D-alanine ligase-like ATP-grasp enzyme
MIEQLLGGQGGQSVDEIKLHVFGGRIQHVFYVSHLAGQTHWFFFDREWIALNEIKGVAPIAKLQSYEKIVRIAEKVAQEFDYIRVDFMVAQEGCFLNELTVYNASGFDVDPEGGPFPFDQVDGIGRHWTLPGAPS